MQRFSHFCHVRYPLSLLLRPSNAARLRRSGDRRGLHREPCRPERRSARSINVCERTDEPWRLPVKVMCRVQRKKMSYSGQRECIL